MAATYEPIATTTLGSAQTSVTLSSIPSTYTDLVLVCNMAFTASGGSGVFQVNSDTGTNYSWTYLSGNGTAASSSRGTTQDKGIFANWAVSVSTTAGENTSILQFHNYSNTTTYKTILYRSGTASTETETGVNLWRSTAAISSITLKNQGGTSIATGSTFTLYGIKAA